ncbi:hypothetical protein OUZ56_013322 [Daphnia magna]|uniref:GMP synthase n=1 Tax=Daphnia magna TaxID=35525 RepID=A0ABQ9Z5J4_9CRUS|nr:hypothetical protein OUZ56_013322 [Daphnia magna]
MKKLHNFLFDNCGLQGGFTLEKRDQQCIDYIRCTVGRDEIVLMLVSGGVDSAFVLPFSIQQFLRVTTRRECRPSIIDNGFLRIDESEQVITSLQQLGLNLLVVELPLHSRVVEPLEDFHKDEVRALGCELCPLAELLEHHPFPGPGLSIRIIYAEEPLLEADFDETQVLICLMVHYANIAAKEHALLNRIEIATSEEDRLLLEELSSHKQYVAKLLPIRTVGVQIRNLDVFVIMP